MNKTRIKVEALVVFLKRVLRREHSASVTAVCSVFAAGHDSIWNITLDLRAAPVLEAWHEPHSFDMIGQHITLHEFVGS